MSEAVTVTTRTREKNFEAVATAGNKEMVLGEYTTARAALNSLAFREDVGT